MAATSGHSAVLKIGGAPATLTEEACTKLGDYGHQITDTAKRVLDPATALTVEKDPGGGFTAVDPDDYTVNYFTGLITFTENSTLWTVRVSGKYIPLLTVANVKSVDVTFGKEKLDTGAYGEATATKIAGRGVCSGTLESFTDLLDDNDSGAGTVAFLALVVAGTPMFLDWQPQGTGKHLRAWVVLESGKVQAQPGQPLTGSIPFDVYPRLSTGEAEWTGYSWDD